VGEITLEKIHKHFGEVRALHDVSVEIAAGEFFTLLGPSGCGKTTLLRTLVGFERPDEGQLVVGGERLEAVPAHLRNMGMVFQNYALFPHMTVAENVAFGLANRGVSAAEAAPRVAKVLETVHLSGFGERTPDQLSGGQQQRVGLARALVIEPRVLLMDEPLSNLDAKLRVQLREEIRALQQELGITTIYVTHDQEEALAVSDRIAVMNEGVVQQVGSPWEIYHQPINAFVASFVGRINFVDTGGDDELSQRLEAGDSPVRLAIRPEDVGVSRDPDASAEDSLSLSGITLSSTFTGPVVSYAVDCGAAGQLCAERHRPAAEALIEPGTPVTLLLPRASLLRFDRSSGERLS
jgi:iron(III) transport system ATP-binding protein